MDDRTAKAFAEQHLEESDNCTRPFHISDLMESKKDKLGRDVKEILWLGPSYAIYRTAKSVHVQFSDCPQVEAVQRRRFAEISPELCELRYLTEQLDRGFAIGWLIRHQPSSLYHHNMAQALMLVMEDKIKEGKRLALQALKMAVERVTNDNTVRYLRSCLVWWALVIVGGAALLFSVPNSHALWLFVVAAMSGATGAVLSVATRLQAFQLKPCHQSNMNMWMSRTRVLIGLMAGVILLLLGTTILQGQLTTTLKMEEWTGVAVLGLVGGFAERLIPNLLRRTVSQVESTDGTPVQAIRNEAMKSDAGPHAAGTNPQ
jgi:hypothetical protein